MNLKKKKFYGNTVLWNSLWKYGFVKSCIKKSFYYLGGKSVLLKTTDGEAEYYVTTS